MRMDLNFLPLQPSLPPANTQRQASTRVGVFAREIERRAGK
jgi:hypothetical protein